MKKFYPSSSGFLQAGTVITKYDSGCLRSILIKSEGIRTGEIPLIYQQVGKAHEDQHLAALKADPRVLAVVPEFKISRQLTDEVEYAGRADFKVFLHGREEPIVHETKGTVSKNTRRDVIKKGLYNVSYLAQLVSYMVQFRTTKGKLVCAYYEDAAEEGAPVELVKVDERTFRVEINDAGNIEVDGQPSGYGVEDLLAHQAAAVEVLTTGTIADRPDKWNQKYGGPCSNCAFKKTCDAWDQGALQSREEFLCSARLDAEAAQTNAKEDPKPFKVKKPKGGKAV